MYTGNDEIGEYPLMLKNIWIKVRRGIENTEVSTFLLLLFVPFILFSILWKVIADKNNVV